MWVLVLAAAGCHASAPVAPRAAVPSVAPVAIELPPTNPTVPVLEAKGLPGVPPRAVTGPTGPFRQLTEPDCLRLSAANATGANLLDDEARVPPPGETCESPSDALRRVLRYHAALELRNQAAAEGLERFFQLTDAEARTDLLRQAFPVIDGLLAKAKAAAAAGVRFPLEVADLERQRSQLESQLEQAELGSRLLNLDLKRRLGLPAQAERLWPGGDFGIDPEPVDPEAAVTAALADRPELRGLRALYHGMTPETLPDVRDLLRAGSPLLGGRFREPVANQGLLMRILPWKCGPDPAALAAETEVRRKQLYALIADRERAVADEARAAALALNSQRVRVGLARDRMLGWEEKLADAVKKRDANQPGAELLEAQTRLDWLRAKAELAAEVAAWHQARVRLRAAQGWLAWEAAGPK
jgi:hypothetical protein